MPADQINDVPTFHLLQPFQQPDHPKGQAEEQEYDGQTDQFHDSLPSRNNVRP